MSLFTLVNQSDHSSPLHPPPIEPTPREEADRLLERLAGHRDLWVRVPIEERVRLLRSGLNGLKEVAEQWVARACAAKGVEPDSNVAGEEWISGPMVTMRYVRLLADSLEQGGSPDPPEIRQRADGRIAACVMPLSWSDRLLYRGVRGEVWIEPGKPADQGGLYRHKRAGREAPGRVSLVLGAGNIGSIPPTDALHKLFLEDEVVLLKMNPVNEYLGPLLRRAFHRLVEEGYLEVVYGNAELGSFLCHHDRVDTVHLTGSDRTYDAIVWGASEEERAERKRKATPLLVKPFSAELGCVTPVIVVPGRWTSDEIDFQARSVASMVTHNASFNCTSAQVLVLPTSWYQRDAFLGALREELVRTPPRRAYYPGALERYREFLDRYPSADVLGRSETGAVPWTLLPQVAPDASELALRREAFCGVLAEVRLSPGRTSDPAAFLEDAVELVNEKVWGTLCCAVLVDPGTRRALGAGFDRALGEMRYGGIGINAWPGIGFGLGGTTWGAFPGHSPADIGSGTGAVHNALLFDSPERSVVEVPFRMVPKPPWFSDHRNLAAVGRKIAEYEADPDPTRLPGLAASAVLG